MFYAEWWFILPVPDWDGGHHSWQKQEVFKGTLYLDWLGTWGATKPAGWGLNSTWTETPSGSGEWEVVPVYTPTQAALATPAMLRTNPVFRFDEPYKTRWLHNDLRNVAYIYTYAVCQRLIAVGGLK